MNTRIAVGVLLPILGALAACGNDGLVTPVSVAPFRLADSATRDGIPVSTPAAAGFDTAVLARLVVDAAAEKSDAVVILRDGKVVYENYFGGANTPIMAMSASKSMVGLAFGFLFHDHLAAVDSRPVDILPTFADVDSRKADITLGELLSESSGLDPTRAGGTIGDITAKGISARTGFPPGTGWQYSNGGVDFLAALAGRIAGKPMDKYLDEKLFAPLGITSVSWYRDPRGVPLGAGEMSIKALDLAKIGQAMLDGGVWRGQPVIPSDWIAESIAQSTPFAMDYGMLWWRLPYYYTGFGITADLLEQWRWMGVAADSTLAKLQPLVGVSYTTPSLLYGAVAGKLASGEYEQMMGRFANGDHIPTSRVTGMASVDGYAAEGWLGQYLLVYPAKHLVAVRMRRATPADYATTVESNSYPLFFSDVYNLVH